MRPGLRFAVAVSDMQGLTRTWLHEPFVNASRKGSAPAQTGKDMATCKTALAVLGDAVYFFVPE